MILSVIYGEDTTLYLKRNEAFKLKSDLRATQIQSK